MKPRDPLMPDIATDWPGGHPPLSRQYRIAMTSAGDRRDTLLGLARERALSADEDAELTKLSILMDIAFTLYMGMTPDQAVAGIAAKSGGGR
ncbi:unnamed protein product [uncultured bacterium]|nr:unnamed protein product [uncultured bacterium]